MTREEAIRQIKHAADRACESQKTARLMHNKMMDIYQQGREDGLKYAQRLIVDYLDDCPLIESQTGYQPKDRIKTDPPNVTTSAGKWTKPCEVCRHEIIAVQPFIKDRDGYGIWENPKYCFNCGRKL